MAVISITYDPPSNLTFVVDDEGVHTLKDTIGPLHEGTYPIYHYPSGHITYTSDGSSHMKIDSERKYGRDGTVAGCTQVGEVVIGWPKP